MKRIVTSRTLGSLLFAFMMPGLVACGETSAPPATPTTEAKDTPTALVEEPTREPTRATAGGWTTFTSDAGFSVDMLGEPKATTQSSDSSLGKITFYFFQVTDGTAQYAAAYNDYPVDISDLDSEQVLQDALKGAAQGVEVTNMQTVDVQGNKAIDGEINPPGTHVWYRGVLVKSRLFQLIVSSPEGDQDQHSDNARRFIESFKLLDR